MENSDLNFQNHGHAIGQEIFSDHSDPKEMMTSSSVVSAAQARLAGRRDSLCLCEMLSET